jgi:hypothetical protein
MIERGRPILAVLLLVWHPASAALRVAMELGAVPVRGAPLAIGMVARLLVVGVGVAAGIALFNRRPGADSLAQAALVLSSVMDLVVYTTSIFPNNRMPGDTPLYIGASLLYHSAWIIYLRRSTPRESP